MDKSLDNEYSPSAWSRRFSNRDEVIEFHVKVASQESERARQLYKYKTISYGSKNNENFDIFGVDLPSDSPMVVYIHGGYWQESNKKMSAYSVAPLVASGIKVIVVEYDLCPTVTLNELVEQIAKCGEFILNYAERVKCRRLTFVGHSAGAHLILCMMDSLSLCAQKPLAIHAIYLISGIYDLTELQHTIINNGNILAVDAGNVKQLSPLMFDFEKWSKNGLVVNIYVGEYESATFIAQSLKLFKCLQSEGFVVDITLIEKCDHFDIVEKLSENSYEIIQHIISDNEIKHI